MEKSIIIIGAGLGGMSAGIYSQMNGYQTQIFEMHTLPGGQCTSWKRQDYTFDICIHHFFGASPNSKLYQLWKELGVMPRETVRPQDCVSVLSPDGKLFMDYYDLDKLEAHLNQISPADKKIIREYIGAIKLFTGKDLMGEMVQGSLWSMLLPLVSHPSSFKYFPLTMKKFAERFLTRF